MPRVEIQMSNVLILIAEDEDRLAAFIEKGLKNNGFETIVAADGVQALEAILQRRGSANDRQPVDLLLLDLGLPIKDGWAVLQEARAQHPDLPIIVVTAMTDERDRQRVLQLGANDYLSKPFKFSDLLAKVKLYLDDV
ncbi:response regulator transcription factor [Chamaesiphon minutus]|uniref:Response regulator with CheY-like receiver domain and winged-helix DNA-binding domain n=1 Tax=Chamaesiphon minutus (strain ATCC 27169 / PCC 6605) TaxID=1173020 RepID=K9UH38_CHAP6|nr:response regulator [Chamaesiphon minutus]AFY93524.1 response regulator with CheY-like receiver domain and winged-helix DNA-binding domain [Chamaesiphon minutus PCC 6605]